MQFKFFLAIIKTFFIEKNTYIASTFCGIEYTGPVSKYLEKELQEGREKKRKDRKKERNEMESILSYLKIHIYTVETSQKCRNREK